MVIYEGCTRFSVCDIRYYMCIAEESALFAVYALVGIGEDSYII